MSDMIEFLDDSIATISVDSSDESLEILIQQDVSLLELDIEYSTEILEGFFKGDKGDPGSGSASYEHVQSVASATWTINHGLGTYKNPVVFLDSAPTAPVVTDIEYPSVNVTVLTFPSAESGRAYL